MNPLTACAYQGPTGGWWISGAVNSFHVASRVHDDIAKATRELELHIVSLARRLNKLVKKAEAAE
jgi:hypothetical protein